MCSSDLTFGSAKSTVFDGLTKVLPDGSSDVNPSSSSSTGGTSVVEVDVVTETDDEVVVDSTVTFCDLLTTSDTGTDTEAPATALSSIIRTNGISMGTF